MIAPGWLPTFACLDTIQVKPMGFAQEAHRAKSGSVNRRAFRADCQTTNDPRGSLAKTVAPGSVTVCPASLLTRGAAGICSTVAC